MSTRIDHPPLVLEVLGRDGTESLPVVLLELTTTSHGVSLLSVLVERAGELLDFTDCGSVVDDVVIVGLRTSA